MDTNEIIKNLFIGNRNSVHDDGYDLIINCTKDLPSTNTRTIRIPVDDSPDESDNLVHYVEQTNVISEIHKVIEDNGKVLVHCWAGAQRSCAVVAIYLIKYYSLSPLEAIMCIKKQRPIAFFTGANFIEAIKYFYLKIKSN